MSYLPAYYFQNLPADVMAEIIAGMQTALPEPSLEEIDHWLNCHNVASSISGWYGKAEEFVEESTEAQKTEPCPVCGSRRVEEGAAAGDTKTKEYVACPDCKTLLARG